MEYKTFLAQIVRSFGLALLHWWPLGLACLLAMWLTWRIGDKSGASLQPRYVLWLLAPALLPVACLLIAARFVGAAPAWALLTVHMMPAFLVVFAVVTASRCQPWMWFVVVVSMTHGWALATAWWVATMAMTG